MPVYFRKSKRLGPVRINVSKSGASLTWFPLWPLTRRWSWNSRTRQQRLDLPGALYYASRRKPKGRRMHPLDRLMLTLVVLGVTAGLVWWSLHWVAEWVGQHSGG